MEKKENILGKHDFITHEGDPFGMLDALVSRFAGVDLQARRVLSTDWPKRWRARNITSKNERANYRVTGWGKTAEESIKDMLAQIDGTADK